LGGSWSDPPYALHDQVAASPWVRLPTDGFRCASYSGGEPPDALTVGVEYPPQVFGNHASITDDVFEAMRRPFAYAHDQPLRATVDSIRTLESGVTVEWVSVDTPYGQRLPIRLHIPNNAQRPFQAMVFFPGGNVVRSRQLPAPILDFLVRSGRVLIDPVFDGTWERNDGRTIQRLSTTASARELIAHWIQDVGRVLDYLEQRSDMDAARVGYVGLSFGAGISMDILPYEPRFQLAVLYSGGFGLRELQESIDRRSALAERVTIPLLQLGGRHDFAQVARLQEELFRAFGTPAEHKRLVIYENAGHWPLPMNEVVRETVDWLDRYLGPVATRP
jgi:dienelactone hydrolase